MVKVVYWERKRKILSHKELADNLGIKDSKVRLIENSGELIELLNREKPEVLIINDKLNALKDSNMLRCLNEAKETIIILIERVNGAKRIRELSHTESGLQEKVISQKELLEKVNLLKLRKTAVSAKYMK